MTVIDELRIRQLLHDIAHEEELNVLLSSQKITFYCGFDPTADSLHVGSLLPLLIMKRLVRAGHKAIALLGTATGAIGDPSGRSSERTLLSAELIEKNKCGIEKQIRGILEEDSNSITVVENHTWVNHLSAIEFLRDVGKHFSVNAMIQKESVRARLENREQGISYTEFSYMLLQAYDYYWLHKNHSCQLQVGGSDQWGNITAGMELIRRKSSDNGTKAYGFTFPLLLSSTGEKFGKTASGAVWLSPERTSPYQFYQYWVNISDEDATSLLPKLSSLPLTECGELIEAAKAAPEKRLLQLQIASEVTEIVHGASELQSAINASRLFFGGSMEGISQQTLLDVFRDVPSASLSEENLQNDFSILDLLVHCGAAKSKGEARRLVEGGGIYVNNQRIVDSHLVIRKSLFIEEKVMILRSGKKHYFLIRFGQ